MKEFENGINYALEAANIRWTYFKQTEDDYHLKEFKDWLNVARIYVENIPSSRSSVEIE